MIQSFFIYNIMMIQSFFYIQHDDNSKLIFSIFYVFIFFIHINDDEDSK